MKKISRVLLAGDFARKDIATGAKVLEGRLRDVGLRVERSSGETPLVDEDADIVVALGGDGATLSAIRRLGDNQIPVMGINFGHTGFLTARRSSELEFVVVYLGHSRFRIARRMRLELEINGEMALYCSAPLRALNDIVLERETGRTVWIDLIRTGKVDTFGGDGLIVSTATGSTAYTKSAGGPILDPQMSAVAITPICPLSLSARGLVRQPGSGVELRINERSAPVRVVVDGRELAQKLKAGDRVVIKRSVPALLALPHDWSFEEVLRQRLKWNS